MQTKERPNKERKKPTNKQTHTKLKNKTKKVKQPKKKILKKADDSKWYTQICKTSNSNDVEYCRFDFSISHWAPKWTAYEWCLQTRHHITPLMDSQLKRDIYIFHFQNYKFPQSNSICHSICPLQSTLTHTQQSQINRSSIKSKPSKCNVFVSITCLSFFSVLFSVLFVNR